MFDGIEFPRLRYHMSLASCQLALLIEARSRGGAVLPASEQDLYETWLSLPLLPATIGSLVMLILHNDY